MTSEKTHSCISLSAHTCFLLVLPCGRRSSPGDTSLKVKECRAICGENLHGFTPHHDVSNSALFFFTLNDEQILFKLSTTYSVACISCSLPSVQTLQSISFWLPMIFMFKLWKWMWFNIISGMCCEIVDTACPFSIDTLVEKSVCGP